MHASECHVQSHTVRRASCDPRTETQQFSFVYIYLLLVHIEHTKVHYFTDVANRDIPLDKYRIFSDISPGAYKRVGAKV